MAMAQYDEVMAGRPRNRHSIPGRDRNSYFPPQAQTVRRIHSAAYPKCTGVLSLKVKRPARETDLTPPHGEEAIMRGVIPPLPPHVLMWCTIKLRARRTVCLCGVTPPDGADYVISLFSIAH